MHLTLVRRTAAHDWARLGAILSRHPELKGRFLKFRAEHDTQKTTLNSLAPAPKLIDWSFYEQNVANKELLNSFMEQYNATVVPQAEVSLDDVDAQQASTSAAIAAELARMEERKVVLAEQLEAINNEKSFEDMTTDEYLASRPWAREQIEALRVQDDHNKQ